MTHVHRPPTPRAADSARSRIGFDVAAAAGLAVSASAAVVAVRRHARAVAALALERVESQRLAEWADASLQELASSRARIQAAADDQRRRIERDLHDGAQQRLVALRVRLSLAGDLLREDPLRGPELLRELGVEAEEALEEVRAVAHGVYPAELVGFGLEAALKDLASREPIRTTVAADGIGRCSPEIEAAVYFCCVEAVQNAAGHAHGADEITIAISIEAGPNLRFEISDNGSGLSAHPITPGGWVVNVRDRLAAVTGRFDIRAAPGGGTRVVASIPLPPQDSMAFEQEENLERAAG